MQVSGHKTKHAPLPSDFSVGLVAHIVDRRICPASVDLQQKSLSHLFVLWDVIVSLHGSRNAITALEPAWLDGDAKNTMEPFFFFLFRFFNVFFVPYISCQKAAVATLQH